MAAPGSARSAQWVAAGIFLSRIAGLVREMVFARFFGTSVSADAWRAASRMPNVLQNLLGEGTLSASFIPEYSKLLEEGREAEAGRLAGVVWRLGRGGVTIMAEVTGLNRNTIMRGQRERRAGLCVRAKKEPARASRAGLPCETSRTRKACTFTCGLRLAPPSCS